MSKEKKTMKKGSKKERIRVLEGDLCLARIALERQARTIQELKATEVELEHSRKKIKLLNLKVERGIRLRKRSQQANGLQLLDADIARRTKELEATSEKYDPKELNKYIRRSPAAALKAPEGRPGAPESTSSSCRAYRGRDLTAKEDCLSAESLKQFHDDILESQRRTEIVCDLLGDYAVQRNSFFDKDSFAKSFQSVPDEIVQLLESALCHTSRNTRDTPSTPLRKDPGAIPQSGNSSPKCNDQTNQTCTPPVNENFFDDEELI